VEADERSAAAADDEVRGASVADVRIRGVGQRTPINQNAAASDLGTVAYGQNATLDFCTAIVGARVHARGELDDAVAKLRELSAADDSALKHVVVVCVGIDRHVEAVEVNDRGCSTCRRDRADA